jgi:CHAT domain-containing protein
MHAAGVYDGSDQQCCADYVVSSYTPTLSALLRAQQTSKAYTRQELRVLTIAAKRSHNPALPPLRFVQREVDDITDLTKQMNIVADSLPRLASKDVIISALEAANIVHLACHGI